MGLVRLALPVVGIALVVAPLFSQAPADIKPSFEVASIKPSMPGARQGITIQPGGRFVADSVSLQLLIAVAYHLQAFQISGADGWIANDQWNIEAKTSDVAVIPAWTPPYIPDVMAIRLQSLLEDRFALRTHREPRERPIYALMIAKDGSKLKAVDPPPQQVPGQPAPARPTLEPNGAIPSDFVPPPGAVLAGPGTIVASAITMEQMVTLLGRLMDRPIIDETGLTGHFNVRLRFAPETAPRGALGAAPADGSPLIPSASGDPSIFTAIQEQLGLKLAPANQPVDVLVVDSAQKPTDN